jgi:hypothetical protein
MPTRRDFELTLIIVVLSRPAFGLARLWAAKTFGTSEPGTVAHGVASIVSVIA